MSDTGFNSTSGRLRTWVIKNSALVVFVAVVVVAFAIGAFGPMHWWGPRPPRPPEWAWYAVEGTQEFVAERPNLIPPIERDGKVLVRAHIFGCGGCDKARRFFGYYEKYTPEAKAELERLRDAGPHEEEFRHYEETPVPGRLFSTDGSRWVSAASEEGMRVMEEIATRCADRKLRYCHPNSEGWDE